MTSDSIDFQPLPQETDIPVRKFFRVPVSSKDNILAIFSGKTFAVANLSATGIAIHCDSCLEFEEGQILADAQVWLGTTRLTGLTGKVVHCSVHASGQLYFGIEWQNMAPEIREQLAAQLEIIKARTLKAEPEDDASETSV